MAVAGATAVYQQWQFAERLFIALLLVAPVRYEHGGMATGGNPSGEVDIRQFGRLDLYFLSQGMPEFYMDLNAAREAKKVSQNLWSIYRGKRFLRLRTGLRIFWLGLQQRYAQDRLHQFVRSLDTIAKAGNRNDFASRCQMFLGR